jgi:hypothetical protein
MAKPMYGRLHSPEPPSALLSLHLHDGVSPLKEVDHETPLGVLDQSDLIAQDIHTSKFVPGCKQDAEALGSCTANTLMEAAAQGLGESEFVGFCRSLIADAAVETCSGYQDVKGAERSGISFYSICTHQTGNPATEWPPTDCGSSGPAVYSEGRRLGVVLAEKIAAAGESLISLMQTGPVMVGSPFFYSWEEPDAQAFVDGNGTAEALEAAIRSGVAGGHAWLLTAIEKLTLTGTGKVEPFGTLLRWRNHWTKGWGDVGCGRIHLSTLIMLGGQCDYRQLRFAS